MQSGKESVSRRKGCDLLARGNWAEEIRKNGLRIKDQFSLRTSVSRIPVVTEFAPDAMYDVILWFCAIRSWIPFWTRCGRTGRRTSFLWGTMCRKNVVLWVTICASRRWRRHCRRKMSCLPFALSAGHREPDRVVSIDLKKDHHRAAAWGGLNAELIGEIFGGTKSKVVYEPNMRGLSALPCGLWVMPAAFACYKTDGDLKKLRRNTVYLGR